MKVSAQPTDCLSRRRLRPPSRIFAAGFIGLLMLHEAAAREGVAAKTVDGARPSLDACAALLTKGRAWHSDLVFAQVNGIPADLDVGIDDGSTEDTFVLQRAARSYETCVQRALLAPDQSGGSSLHVRIVIGRQEAASAATESSSWRARSKRQKEKSPPYLPHCFEPLSETMNWQVTVNVKFAEKPGPKVQDWTVSSDLSRSEDGRRLLRAFSECLASSLQIVQKPVYR